jgi:hypothetical protein
MHEDESQPHAFQHLLAHKAPELLPIFRWLLAGPWLADGFFRELTRPPTVAELVRLKRMIKREGPRFNGLLASFVEASGQAPAVRVEAQLDRMLELDPSLWTHPNQVMDRPFSDSADLLVACRMRLEDVEKEEGRRRLVAVEGKLALAVRIEEKARQRRGE